MSWCKPSPRRKPSRNASLGQRSTSLVGNLLVNSSSVPCYYQLIQGNTNFYSPVTRHLSHKVEARFLRINPQFYHYWMCLRTEVYGCSPNQGTRRIPWTRKTARMTNCLQALRCVQRTRMVTESLQASNENEWSKYRYHAFNSVRSGWTTCTKSA